MTVQYVLASITAILAIVAVVAATIAVRAAQTARQLAVRQVDEPLVADARAQQYAVRDTQTDQLVPSDHVAASEQTNAQPDHAELPVKVAPDTVIVPASTEQVVDAIMARPRYRIAATAAGVLHALKPTNRDRIRGIVRREFARRRRSRAANARHGYVEPPRNNEEWISP